MMITLICSFLVTWIGLPVIYLLLSGKRKPSKNEPALHERKSGKWISFFVLRPAISFVFVLALIASVYYISNRLETGFLPEMDEGSIVLDYKSPPGTSLQETDRMLREVEKLLPTIPEIETYSRRTGTQMGFFITEPQRWRLPDSASERPQTHYERSDRRNPAESGIDTTGTANRLRTGDWRYARRFNEFDTTY